MAMWNVKIKTDSGSDKTVQVPGDDKKEAFMNGYVLALQHEKVYGVSVIGLA